MPSSGSGLWTPITGGPGTGLSVARPIPYTLLALARYAQMVGIAPAHFMGATASDLSPQVFPADTCSDLWPRHSWQKHDHISHEDLAYAIQQAEMELANFIGYWPAPMWLADEKHPYPRDFYRTSLYQVADVRGFGKGLTAKYGRFVQAGRRTVSLLGTATTVGGSLAYSDQDSDGLYETATITLNGADDDYTCEYKVYFYGQDGEQEWEVRPLRSRSVSGGILTIILDSWLLIDPDILSSFPTEDGWSAVNISTTANFVTSVEVYREYTDTTQASASFYWEVNSACSFCGGTGCAACQLTEQTGCLHVRDHDMGIVVPNPATYSQADAEWQFTEYTECRAPDNVSLWYYAGERDNRYLRGVSCDPLSDFWAWTIIYLATARLERPPCGCSGLKDWFDQMREDYAIVDNNVPFNELANPFGTRRGEVMAWRRVSRLVTKRPRVAVI